MTLVPVGAARNLKSAAVDKAGGQPVHTYPCCGGSAAFLRSRNSKFEDYSTPRRRAERKRERSFLLSRARLTGGSFRNPPTRARMNSWVRLAGLSKRKVWKVSRSRAWSMTRSKLSSGWKTFWGRCCKVQGAGGAFEGADAAAQAEGADLGDFLTGRDSCPVALASRWTASTGQALAHRPQPVHRLSSTAAA